jgi:hypothetical protein
MFTYDSDGNRLPFDPDIVRDGLAGCLLCGCRSIRVIGVFCPQTAEMRHAILMLRQHPVVPGRTAATSYGLCAEHAVDPDLDWIERVILTAASRVRLQ